MFRSTFYPVPFVPPRDGAAAFWGFMMLAQGLAFYDAGAALLRMRSSVSASLLALLRWGVRSRLSRAIATRRLVAIRNSFVEIMLLLLWPACVAPLAGTRLSHTRLNRQDDY